MMDEFADSRKEKIAIYALITFVIIVTMAIGLAVIAKAFQSVYHRIGSQRGRIK